MLGNSIILFKEIMKHTNNVFIVSLIKKFIIYLDVPIFFSNDFSNDRHMAKKKKVLMLLFVSESDLDYCVTSPLGFLVKEWTTKTI